MSKFFIVDLATAIGLGIGSTLAVAAFLFVRQQVLDFLRRE